MTQKDGAPIPRALETAMRVIDNDLGEITVTRDGREIRGWSYTNDDEHRNKMLAAREYVEGYEDAYRALGLLAHMHRSGSWVGLPVDTCAICGRDVRDDIHSRRT